MYINSVLNNNSKNTFSSKKISFGKGVSQVVVNRDLYFDNFDPHHIAAGSFWGRNSESIRKQFMPFMRLSKIAQTVPHENGCVFTVSVTNKQIKTLRSIADKLNDTTIEKPSLYWVPDVVVDRESGDTFTRVNKNYPAVPSRRLNSVFSNYEYPLVSDYMRKISEENSKDVVIAIGQTRRDLAFINPFKYFQVEPSYENFDKIRDLPFRSAFIYDETTPKDLLAELRELEKFCNADGNVRFALVNARKVKQTTAVAHSILLLQKAYAQFAPEFRMSISDDLRVLLESTDLEYVVSRQEDSKVPWNPIKSWVKQSSEQVPIMNRFFKSVLKNKIATGLVLSAIGIPMYLKYTPVKKQTLQHN